MDNYWADLQRSEQGLPPEPLSFTGDEVAEYLHDNPDDPELEVLGLAMERDMHDRMRRLEEENEQLRSELYDDES